MINMSCKTSVYSIIMVKLNGAHNSPPPSSHSTVTVTLDMIFRDVYSCHRMVFCIAPLSVTLQEKQMLVKFPYFSPKSVPQAVSVNRESPKSSFFSYGRENIAVLLSFSWENQLYGRCKNTPIFTLLLKNIHNRDTHTTSCTHVCKRKCLRVA